MIEEKIKVRVLKKDGYLVVRPADKAEREGLAKEADGALLKDTKTRFWGRTANQIATELLQLSERKRTRIELPRRSTQAKVNRDILLSWTISNKRKREKRRETIKQINMTIAALNNIFVTDARYQKKARITVPSGIIHDMDGSTLLWLSVILSAKKDFLTYHDSPKREDLLDYTTARDFLLDDDYHIDLDDPELLKHGGGKYVNLRDLLDLCVENCNGRRIDAHVISPSVTRLRASLANASGDPKLIAQYCYNEEKE